MSSSRFTFDADNLVRNLNNFEDRVSASLRMFAETSALELEGYAKEHAPWKDRSGAARQRLTGRATQTSTGFRIQLAHGVNYGIYLELGHEKNFAIIYPTIEYVGSTQIMPALRNFMNRMNYEER